jgi:hypothetical protein
MSYVIAQYSAEFRVTEFDEIPGTPLLFVYGKNSAHVQPLGDTYMFSDF